MNNNILYRFLSALAALLCLSSCGLEELTNSLQNSDGYIEFVARPTSYNKYDVATKSDGDLSTFDDNEIHNAFIIIFDSQGRKLLCQEMVDGSLSLKTDKGIGNVTACILANVPSDFAHGIIGTTKPTTAPETDNNLYLNSAVLDFNYIAAPSLTTMGVPSIDLDSDGGENTASVPCIPMFGITSNPVNFSSANTSVQISLKRLFAKVSVDLSMAINLDSWLSQQVSRLSYFQLNYYYLANMPTKVKLLESDSQSAWATPPYAYADNISSGSLRDIQIYNNNADTAHEFYFYVPEYYINQKDDAKLDEIYKPLNFPDGTRPIYLFIDGTFVQYSVSETDLQYQIYLGRDEVSDFSLARNINYINYLTISGVSNHNKGTEGVNLDHRVTTTVITNPVAKEGKSANCYIIGKTGDYVFPAYKGAYNDLTKAILCNNQTAKTIETIPSNNSNGITLSNLSYDPETNFISFTVDELASGNVVLVLKNEDGSTEWSWHLWCSPIEDYDILGWGVMGTQTYPNGAGELHDRNLGASPNALELQTPGIVNGCYYKYGAKEPYFNGGYNGGGSNGDYTWDPTKDANLNDNTKAVNDPCPPGYHVPASTIFGVEATKEHGGDVDLGVISFTSFRFWNNGTTNILDGIDYLLDDIYFPYSGYVGSDNFIKTGEGLENTFTHFKANDYRSFSISGVRTEEKQIGAIQEKEALGGLIKYETRTVGYTEYEYTEFEYEVKLKVSKIGSLWGSGNQYYSFAYKENNWNDLKIVKCKVKSCETTRQQQRTYELVNTGSFWKPNYQWQLQDDWYELTAPQTGTWSATQELTDESNNVVIETNTIGSINNESWRSRLKSNQSSNRTHTIEGNKSNTEIAGYGLQIRCICD